MDQPYLGLKVSELRKEKGFTQEQLAEKCEVSTRTIQRIECGEVDPRAYTLHCLGQALEFDFEQQNLPNENLLLVVLHLSSLVCLLIIPLIIWILKRGQSYKIDQQGRKVLNFQITMVLILFSSLLAIVFALVIPIVLAGTGTGSSQAEWSYAMILNAIVLGLNALIGVFCCIEGVLNAVRSQSDKLVHYPLSIPFLR